MSLTLVLVVGVVRWKWYEYLVKIHQNLWWCRMDGKYRLTAIAVVLHGEIEDALRALGGQSKGTRINISALTRECRNWLMPELQTKLAKIRALRSKVYHNGKHSRRLFEHDQPLF